RARLAPHHPPRLQLEARQAARRRLAHLQPEAEPGAQRLLQRRAHARPAARADFHEDAGLVQLARAEDLDLELLDGREAPHDVLDSGRKDVHAAQDQHVVEAAEDAALEPPERPAARAGAVGEAHAVAGAVADHRRAEAPEVRQHQLALAYRRARRRIQHLGDELRLVDVQAGLRRALVA